MGGNATKVPVALRGGDLVGSKSSFFSMNSDEAQELTTLLTSLCCRCRDAKVVVEPSCPENVANSFCGSDGPRESAYALVLRDAVLERGDMKFIREHPSVTKVHFIECLGVCDLGMLSGHLSLTELRVEVRGKVSHYEALRELPSLKNLWLRNNKMTTADFLHVGEVKGLEKLTLRGALNLKCLEVVAQLPQLKALDLSETLITDKCLRAVGLCKALMRLDLSCCNRLRDVSLLTRIPTLEELNLSHCKHLKDIGPLCRLPRLRVLDLRGTRITRRMVYSLSSCANLTELYISFCEGLADVTRRLQIESLEELDAQWRKNLKRAGNALACLPRLRVLDLSNTSVDGESLRSLEGSTCLERLDLSSCSHVKDLRFLSGIVTLEELNLRGCCHITNGMGAVKDLPRLRVLNMSSTPLCPGFFSDISGIASLVELDFSSCWEAPSPSSFPDFPAKMNAGERRGFFCLSSNPVEGAALLGRLPKLQSLNMSCTAVTDDCVRGLGMCESLVWLDLSSCVKLTDVTPLSFVETLEEVNLSWCKNLKSGSGVLRHLPRLRVLDLKSTAVDNRCFRGVDHKGGLVNRMLQWSGLTVPRFLRRLICCDGSLVTLDFSSCWGLTDVAPLAAIATLEELRLRACKNLQGGVDDLGRLPELQLLDLSGTPITDDSLRGLSRSKSLASLNLSACANLTDVSPLMRISSLEELDLQESGHIHKGIRELVNLPRLYVVYLSGTGGSLEAAAGLKERGVHVRWT